LLVLLQGRVVLAVIHQVLGQPAHRIQVVAV
jgi:hypothetical protein